MTIAALIVAAGRGARAAALGLVPKQYVELHGKTVLARTVEAFAVHPRIDCIQVVIHPDDAVLYEVALGAGRPARLAAPACGGATRQESVRLGLEALAARRPGRVLIHDAARPFVGADLIDRVVAALDGCPGAIAALPLSDTLKRANGHGRIAGTIDRTGLWRAQTPQGFHFETILAAHRAAHAAGLSAFTDDAAIAEWAGHEVALVEGNELNRKLTTVEDVTMAADMLAREGPARPYEVRTGTGFDVHRFAPGNSVWLCGVEIPHVARLEGHSDADVGLHALTDAILGAIAEGDIGVHFPPSDMNWKNAESHIFLRHAADLVARRGGLIVNVDVTILAESPRITPHRAAMCRRVADILGIDVARASVKATTTEGLGFTGRREGIAAMATASIALP